jgi:hypothetical protein
MKISRNKYLFQKIQNVVGIVVGVDCSITWADLSCDFKLSNWGQVAVVSSKGRLKPHEIFEAVSKQSLLQYLLLNFLYLRWTKPVI